MVTALFQAFIAWPSGSLALLDNTIIILEMLQPFEDAATADTLGFAFYLSRKKLCKHFTYGYGRKEDIAA
jgi:Predicted Co/Zn/Cd cation transporters